MDFKKYLVNVMDWSESTLAYLLHRCHCIPPLRFKNLLVNNEIFHWRDEDFDLLVAVKISVDH